MFPFYLCTILEWYMRDYQFSNRMSALDFAPFEIFGLHSTPAPELTKESASSLDFDVKLQRSRRAQVTEFGFWMLKNSTIELFRDKVN